MTVSPPSTTPQSSPPDQDGHGRRLLNATAIMASGTAVSRVLGLVRTMLIAFILGNATMRVEVFNLAMLIPNSLYLLLAGGTLNNVLVPQIVRAVKHDEDGGAAFIDRIITGFVLALAAVTAIFTIATPLVLAIYAGSWQAPGLADQWRSLVMMTFLTMPQLFFYGLFFLIGQVLNARENFGPMMWAPILNNVVSIGVFSLYLSVWGTQTDLHVAFTDQQVWLLGIGSTVGIIAQTVILLPVLRRVGITYRPRFDLKGTGLGHTFHIAKWMVGFVALTSLAQVVVTSLATSAAAVGAATGQAGAGVTAYQNAYLIWILPHSLLTVSLATAMLPAASKAAAEGDLAGVGVETGRALRLALTFLVPASAAFVALADPIARIIFGNGSGASDYHFVSWTLAAFGIGLVPYTIQYLYLRAFYALDNTRTPFLLQIWISGANMVAALVLVLAWSDPPTVAARLALSYSLSYFLGVFLTHRALKRRLPELSGRSVVQHVAKLLIPSLAAILPAWVITWFAAGSSSTFLRLGGFAVAAAVALLLFVFLAKRLGIPEAATLLDLLRRRKPDGGEADAAEAIIDEEDEEATTALDSDDVAIDQPNDDPDGTGVFVAIRNADPLDYPEPDTGAVVGLVLADRYELVEQLAVFEGSETWRAKDPVLGRPVLVHLLTAGPATQRVLAAARSAAVATDSRFLRVLDVVEAQRGVSAYVVYEYEAGQTVEKLLRTGPLTAVETAWIVREVADALVPLHAQGHFHQHLSPASVLINSTGNVKILGFEVDAALRSEGAPTSASTAVDVLALGDLLYACLVAHWPHGARFGLPAAPQEHGRAVSPATVRSGVAPALDQVVERISSANPRGRGSRLITAQAIVAELSSILGAANASDALRARLNQSDVAEPAASPVPIADASAPPVPTPAANHVHVSAAVPDEDDDEPFVDSALAHGEAFTPIPPPQPNKQQRQIPLMLLSSLLVIAVGLLCAGVLSIRAAATSRVAVLAIAAVDDFDPKQDGGSGGEHSAQVPLAIDGNLQTAWTTETYRKGKLSKHGVGLVVDLGAPRTVDTVTVHLTGQGTDLDLRVPIAAKDSAPMKTVDSWKVVAATKNAGEEASFDLHGSTQRFLLVYLTDLPAIGGGKYQGGIAEVVVSGS